MGLVGACVADPGEDADLALAVERCEAAERRMPAQAVVLGERDTGRGRQRQPRAQPSVERVAAREEHRERVGPAVEEDRDEDALRPCCGCGCDAFVERAR